jgi:hypothetical protein
MSYPRLSLELSPGNESGLRPQETWPIHRHRQSGLVDLQGDGYELAHQEAVRALNHQQAALNEFRTRAGILLSGAAIATSFLGGQALDTGEVSAWSWIAIGCFVGLGGSTLMILWPYKGWEFGAFPHSVIATYIETENPLPLPMILRDLALHMENSYDKNASRLERVIRFFRAAALLLTTETLAWVIDIATRT